MAAGRMSRQARQLRTSEVEIAFRAGQLQKLTVCGGSSVVTVDDGEILEC